MLKYKIKLWVYKIKSIFVKPKPTDNYIFIYEEED